MKNLILAFTMLFAITIVSPELYSQNKDHQRGKDLRMEIKKQLNLTEDQEKKIETMRFSHQESMIKLKSDLELKELEMRKLKSSDNFSRSSIINLTKEISSIKGDMALAVTNHQMDIYDLLDVNQKKIWLEMQDQFGNMKHRMRDKMRERENW
ncbi:MAG TPA: Spy/CpxP family protein refolding chaperone [Ignavibacteriaceae bacterium]